MAAIKRKGLTDGVTNEWTIIGKVKAGQEQALRAFAEAETKKRRESGVVEEFVIPVGTVHDYRWVLFENGTRIMFMSNFDGSWDAYIEDFFAAKGVGKGFDDAFSFCEGYDRNASVSAKKDWMQAHTVEALTYTRAYHGTVKEIWKALEVEKAFEQVLDTPGAEKALTNPGLKPLLDLAAK